MMIYEIFAVFRTHEKYSGNELGGILFTGFGRRALVLLGILRNLVDAPLQRQGRGNLLADRRLEAHLVVLEVVPAVARRARVGLVLHRDPALDLVVLEVAVARRRGLEPNRLQRIAGQSRKF